MALRVTQTCGEVLTTAVPKLRVTQVAAEAITLALSNGMVSTVLLARLTKPSNPKALVTNVVVSRLVDPIDGQNKALLSNVVLSRLVKRRQTLIGVSGLASSQGFGTPGTGYFAPDENITQFADNSAQFGSAILGRMQLGSVSAGSLQTITGTAGLASSQAFGIGGSFSSPTDHVANIVFDCSSDLSFTATRMVFGPLLMNGMFTDFGATAMKTLYGKPVLGGAGSNLQITSSNQYYALNLVIGGATAFTIRAGQRYQFGVGFLCPGATNLVLRAGTMYRSTTGWTVPGMNTNFVLRPGVKTTGLLSIPGSTNVVFGYATGKAASVLMTGATNLTIGYNVSYGATTNWSATGATDMSIRPGVYYRRGTGVSMAGSTDLSIIRSNLKYAVRGMLMDLNSALVLRPGVYYRSGTGMTMGGNTTAVFRGGIHSFLNINIALAMNVLFGQEFDRLTFSAPSQFNATFAASAIIQDANSVVALIRDGRDVYTDQMPSASFQYQGVKAIATNTQIGRTIHKTGFGSTRPTGNFSRILKHFQAGEETVIFNLFNTAVMNATPMLPASFTASGKTARTDEVSQVGAFKQETGVLELTTNARLTQNVVSTIVRGDSNVRVAQLSVEALNVQPSKARTSQYALEVLKLANLGAVQQEATEVLANGSPSVSVDRVNQVATELLVSIKANTLVTQVAVNWLKGSGANIPVHTSQIVREMLVEHVPDESFSLMRVQQDAVEILNDAHPNADVQQSAVECMFNMARNAQVQQAVVEVISNEYRNARINQQAIEVLQNGGAKIRAQHSCVECLVAARFDGTVAALVLNPKYHV